MAYCKFALIGFLFFVNLSFAGYAQLSPPAGWLAGLGAAVPGNAGTFSFGMAANGANFRAGTLTTQAVLNVAGQSVTLPATMRFAANAPRIAAAAIFLSPPLRLAAGIATWLGLAGIVWDAASGKWNAPDPTATVSDGYGWWVYSISNIQPSASAACAEVAGSGSSITGPYSDGTMNCYRQLSSGSKEFVSSMRKAANSKCPAGWFITPAGCTETAQPKILTETDFADSLDPVKFPSRVMPDSVPSEMPNVPLPYGLPVVNPDGGSDPASKPFFLPTGNPVPTADPAVWNQPGIRVTPSPSTDSPWRVDVYPENIPQSSPVPKTPAELNPATPPATEPLPADKLGLCDLYPNIAACQPAAKPEDVVDFCKANPDVLACQKLDNPDAPELEKKDISASITPSSGWGASDASCPAPRRLVGAKVDMPFTMMCDFMTGIRPILIGIAWLSAAFILLGMKGGAD